MTTPSGDRGVTGQDVGVRAVCVLGLGLIGGSVLRAAAKAGRPAWGTSAAEADRTAARADGYEVEPTVADALRRAAAEDALIVLAVPLTSLDAVLREIAEHTPTGLLTDVISVKGPVLDAVRDRLPRIRYVGGHPMSGASASGWAAGNAELFHDAAWVVSTDPVDEVGPALSASEPDDEHDELGADDEHELGADERGPWDVELWGEVARLALDCGAHVVPATAAEHDSVVARISHLPHVLAAVLASVGGDGGPLALALAAGSFGDGTRVAGSRPELVRAMCEGNRSALLDALDDALGRLGAARGSLASTGSLAATVNAGNQSRLDYLRARTSGDAGAPVRIDLTTAAARAELLAVGRSGGRITALDGTVVSGVIPDDV